MPKDIMRVGRQEPTRTQGPAVQLEIDPDRLTQKNGYSCIALSVDTSKRLVRLIQDKIALIEALEAAKKGGK